MGRLVGALLIGLIVGAIGVFAFIERAPVPSVVWHGQRIDDLALHVLAFAALSGTIALWRPITRASVISLVGVAGAVEAIQFAMPSRTASVLDFGASLLGIGIGTVLAGLFQRFVGDRFA